MCSAKVMKVQYNMLLDRAPALFSEVEERLPVLRVN